MSASRLLCIVAVLSALTLAAGAALADNIGPDDRRISITGPDGDPAHDARTPVVAYDSIEQNYLAVWSADDTDGQFHIYGRLLSGSAGAPLGAAFRISPDGPAAADHFQPAVAFSAEHGDYLVVWSSDLLNAGAFEIMGRSVGSDGVPAPVVHRYSDAGTVDTDPHFDAVTPDLAWHSGLDAFVLTWAADENEGVDLLDGRFEIYGQLVAGATGAETGANDFRISYSLGGAVQNDVIEPTVAVDPGGARWWVAFEGDITSDAVHDPEIWMYGCTADVPDGLGTNISLMGGDIYDGLSARNPDLAYVPSSGELMCVWDGVAAAGAQPQIYGQRLNVDGSKIGSMLPLSAGAGTLYGDLREAVQPQIAIDPVSDEWFIAWRGDLDDGLLQFDYEVWARRFDDTGTAVDAAAFALSEMDPALDPVAGAGAPAVAINALHGYKLVVWSGDLDSSPGGEHEIYAQAWSDAGASPVDETPAATFALHGARPNPFNPQTTIAFDLPRAQPVTLHIYDAAGRRVRRLLDGEPGRAGRNEVKWNGRDDAGRQAASGVYLYLLESGADRRTDRMVLLK